MEKLKSSPLLVSSTAFLITAFFAEAFKSSQQENGKNLLENEFLQNGMESAVSLLNMLNF